MSPAAALSQLVEQSLPRLVPCKRLGLRQGEVLIHAPGFEDRTLASAEIIGRTRKAQAILLRYRPKNSTNRLGEVRERLAARGVENSDYHVLTYDRFAPAHFEKHLRTKLRGMRATGVVVDVSTMSKLAILLVLNTCFALKLRVRIFYAEAEEYGPNRAEFDAAKVAGKVHQPTLQIFTGVHGVVRVSSLASVAMQGQPTAAIVFMSFNDALTQVLLNTVYPGRLLLINGRPPVHIWREQATAWIHDQVRREWENDNPVRKLSKVGGVPMPKRVTCTLDYKQTANLLLKLYWDLSPNHRVLLAPSGSKMQAVGCFLVKALHPDIHIEYPSPEGFQPEYSRGIGERWLLDFGDMNKRIAVLSAQEHRLALQIPT